MSGDAIKENLDMNRTRTNCCTLAGFLLVVSALFLIGPLGPAARAAGSGPAWELSAVPYPSNFKPGASGNTGPIGPAYGIIARNIGGEETSGPVSLRIKLPAGLTVASGQLELEQEAKVYPTPNPFAIEYTCSSSVGMTEAVCTTSKAVRSGAIAKMLIGVKVEAAETVPPSVLTAEAFVEGGGAASESTTSPVRVTESTAPFDFVEGPAGMYGSLSDASGAAATQAGAHPFQMTLGFGFPYYVSSEPVASGFGLKDLDTTLPRGLVVNPNATPERCTAAQLERNGCPVESQVGVVQPLLGTSQLTGGLIGVYNMVPAPGVPAELGFEVAGGVVIHVRGHLKSNGEYVLAASAKDTLAKLVVIGAAVTLWGTPSDEAHDPVRGRCGESGIQPSCSNGRTTVVRTGQAFLTTPGDCQTRPLTVSAEASSWLEPDVFHDRSFTFEEGAGTPLALKGCNKLRFEPTIEAHPTTDRADSPSGLDFNLHQPQAQPNEELSPAVLKDVEVTLPAGMTVNTASADGQEACSEGEIGLTSGSARPLVFDERAAACPNGSKIGTLSATTPLLDHSLSGAAYLAEPFKNPFGSLLALYLAIEDEQTGIITKLAGEVRPDPKTGQLTTVFKENPELPIEDISLKVFGGDRASLKTPVTCGGYSATAKLTPWSSPEAADATPTSDPFHVNVSASGGSSCPTEESSAANAPSLKAGSLTPTAGAYSPFVFKLTREDGSQRIGSISATLPPGVSGRLAGIPYCSEAQIAAAMAREKPNEGAAEIASPSCPLASEVGTATVGSGAGPKPFYVRGHAYLAGPYKGAPLSLVIITPAVAGPFDLGTVVVRTALNVNLETAQITAVSDPLPTIIDGIPLDVRSVAVDLGRPNFTLNPTSCNPMQVLGSSISTLNQAAPLASRFQVGGCKGLGFKPKLKISLKGPTKRTGHPALKTVITYPKKGAYANLARVQVGLPHAEFLDQANLDKVCTQPELKSNTCPASSIYGHAKAWSPLLEKPLEGPVYLGVGYGHKLPDIVADLNGQVRILAHGRVDTTKKAGLRATFEVVPDAPVSRIVVEMKGGKKYGLLVNSENVCRKTQRASARLVAQNGKVAQLQPKIANSCKRKKAATKHRGGK